jgi:hypothetical protein
MVENYGKVIYSVKHNIYIVTNTQLATCFGSSELSSGQCLICKHGAFSECAHYGIPLRLQTIFILKLKLKSIYIYTYICVKTSISTLVNLY